MANNHSSLLEKRNYRRRYRKFLGRLRRAREEAGLTQAEVAQRLGRPQSFMSKCETGERRVDVVELFIFAQLYSVDIDYFRV